MIWSVCNGESHITPISGTLYRLVESQEQVATMGYVDTLEEQALLEDMLEQAKPVYREDMQAYHFLLSTPFRYPPLQWGSRFGTSNEPSLFYAGSKPSVTLAESAYYRFVFLYSMEAIHEQDKIRSEHSMFSVDYQTDLAVQLHTVPFNQYQTELTDPKLYSHTQQLGSDLRIAGIEAFEYQSARDPNNGVCIALFEPSPFCQHEPKNRSEWLCETSAAGVSFKQLDENDIVHFPLSTFLVGGILPLPA